MRCSLEVEIPKMSRGFTPFYFLMLASGNCIIGCASEIHPWVSIITDKMRPIIILTFLQLFALTRSRYYPIHEYYLEPSSSGVSLGKKAYILTAIY